MTLFIFHWSHSSSLVYELSTSLKVILLNFTAFYDIFNMWWNPQLYFDAMQVAVLSNITVAMYQCNSVWVWRIGMGLRACL